MKSSGQMTTAGVYMSRWNERGNWRAGTRRHEQEQARRKKARATPGHPLREPFKSAKLNPSLAEPMTVERRTEQRVTLTSKHPSGRFYRDAVITIGDRSFPVSEVSLSSERATEPARS